MIVLSKMFFNLIVMVCITIKQTALSILSFYHGYFKTESASSFHFCVSAFSFFLLILALYFFRRPEYIFLALYFFGMFSLVVFLQGLSEKSMEDKLNKSKN